MRHSVPTELVAIDPEPTLTGPFGCDAQVGLPNDMLWCGLFSSRLGPSSGQVLLGERALRPVSLIE